MIDRIRVWPLVMLAVVGVGQTGQPPASRELPTGSVANVSGFVFDSLADLPLANADVQLLGDGSSPRVYDARTDSLGRFAVAAVEAGNYVVGFFHPRVDSLGIDLPPVQVTVAPDAPTEIRLATPSRRTIAASICASDSLTTNGALFLGAVRDAATGDRLAGAVVSVQWSMLAFQDAGLASVKTGGIVPASPDGHFAVCNLPADAEFTVRAAVGADTSGAVALQFPEVGILARDIYVAPLNSSEDSASARLSGRVVTQSGAPVVGARVSLWGWGGVRTNESGVFAFPDVPGGSTTLDVRGVGFEPVRRSIDLRTGASRNNTADIVVERATTTLAPVTIVDTRVSSVLLRSGFEERRLGGSGRFLDAEDFEKLPITNTTEALGRFPGMLLRNAGRGSRIYMRDPHGLVCSPMVWVDGAPYSPAAESDGAVDIDILAAPNQIAGMEIYRRVSQAPLRFGGTTRSACGVIVIWRKGQ